MLKTPRPRSLPTVLSSGIWMESLPKSRDYINMDSQVVYFISNALSTLTILSCLFLKVPQIMSIREKKSAEGIYVQAMLMEITGFTIVTLYNYTNQYSLMTYLEYPIILVQIYVMLYYVLKYKQILDQALVPLTAMVYLTFIVGFATQTLPKEILAILLPFCTPLASFAKVTYIYGIIKAANADAVSLTTWIISVSTNLVRLFTVFVDSADFTLMMNFVVSSLLSLSVLLTAIYYQKLTSEKATSPVSAKSKYHNKGCSCSSDSCRCDSHLHDD